MSRSRNLHRAGLCCAVLVPLCLAGTSVRSLLRAQTGQSPPTFRLTVLGTTDLHGRLEPTDYLTNQPAQVGLAKIATLVRLVRTEQPNALLVDSGDALQGTPLTYYFARKDPGKPNPMILAMDAIGYDAMVLGNHEFDFGLEALWKAKQEAYFPILAANIEQNYPVGSQYFKPYIVRVVAGVRVAIVGFVTPAIPNWEIPANYDGYQFEPIVDAARRVIPQVRSLADVVIVLAHSGLGPDPATGAGSEAYDLPDENAVLALAEQVPGIDVILFGHTHREIPERMVNGVLLAQPKNWGASLSRVDLDLTQTENGHWRVISKHATILPVTERVPADPQIAKLAEPYDKATQAYLDTPIATSSRELRATNSRFEDEPLVDLIHSVQLEYGHADVSMATMSFTGATIPAGRVTIRQIAPLYIFENYLYTVEMTGAQIREALEHAASFFQSWPLAAGESVRLPSFSVDSAEGVDYTMDLRLPVGHRIVNLRFKGKPLDDSRKLRVAVSNYRYAGGDNYTVYSNLPVVYRSPEEIRDLIIEHVSRTRSIPTKANHNWHIEPPEALAALRRAAADANRSASSAPKFAPTISIAPPRTTETRGVVEMSKK